MGLDIMIQNEKHCICSNCKNLRICKFSEKGFNIANVIRNTNEEDGIPFKLTCSFYLSTLPYISTLHGDPAVKLADLTSGRTKKQEN